MCDGGAVSIPLASLVIGAATSMASAEQQRQQAEAQSEYQSAQAAEYARVSDLNNKAAVQEYVNQSAAERINQMQEQQATSEKIQETQREALEKKGSMLASTNAAGGALNMLMADFDRQEAVRKDSFRQQYDMNTAGHEINIAGMRDTAQNRINSQAKFISPGASSSNSFLSTALGIGSAAISAYGQYDKYNNRGADNIKSTKSKV